MSWRTISSGRRTAKGSSPTSFLAHQTAWPSPSGLRLPGQEKFARWNLGIADFFQHVMLVAALKHVFKLGLEVKVLLQHFLVTTCNKNKFFNSGLARFLENMLDQRAVIDRQHLLRHDFRRREKARAEPGHGEDCFFNWFVSHRRYVSHF
jgi:hypothetical protein